MTAAPQTTPLATAGETTASQFVPALRTAFVSALVAFGLAFPIISYHAESNIENELVLISRWPLSFGISALVFVFVFLRQMSTSDWRIWFDRVGSIAAGGMGGALVQAAREGEGTAPPSAARVAFGRFFGPFMLGLVIVFPLLMLGLLGPTGSLKWINNYGVQIMIYVMLGWGLNIVVGLAGLLDLGYVAFYAVGAYSYALLSTTFGLLVLDLPAARRIARGDVGRHSRLPGVEASRRLSGDRDARLRRDHPPRAHQLGRPDQRLRRHQQHPARQLLRHSL